MDMISVDFISGSNTSSWLSESSRAAQVWLPYEHKDEEHKCKLNCFSRETLEHYQTGENVVDGTVCSYDNQHNVCVQGSCVKLGCDKVVLPTRSLRAKDTICFSD